MFWRIASLLGITFTVVIVGVSAAMNELRPCAPLSLKHVLAQELIKGLQAVSDSLLRYSTTRMLRENESGLFLSLCRAFIEVNSLPMLIIDLQIVFITINNPLALTHSYELSFPFKGCLPTLCHMLWALLPWWGCTYHGCKEFI